MLILASQSPRRRRLLKSAGLTFEIRPVDIDETPESGEEPGAYVARMAHEKAAAALEKLTLARDDVVLTADTTVVLDGEVIGKPLDRADAVAMICKLAGRTHVVYSGVCVATADGLCDETLVKTAVTFRPLSEDEARRYIALGESDDKAGAYAIQGEGGALVDRVDGSYTNVIGLPLTETLQLLEKAGVSW